MINDNNNMFTPILGLAATVSFVTPVNDYTAVEWHQSDVDSTLIENMTNN